eukprot:UN3184
MVLALNVSVYFCKLLPLHMNGNLPVGIGMHVFAMICDLIHGFGVRRRLFFASRQRDMRGGGRAQPRWATLQDSCRP